MSEPPARRDTPRHTALVLSGGGARGAYQAGVLSGLAELGLIPHGRSPFGILVGSSAGSINVGMLAAYAENLAGGVEQLVDVWGGLRARDVFRTDLRSLGGIGARWAWDLSFGGALRRVQPKSLLDTAPLRTLLQRIPLAQIAGAVRHGALHAVAVAATDLYTSNGYLFVQGAAGIRRWRRSRWRIVLESLTIEHLMASSAIPIFFPSIEIDGRHFGDGCIRNTAPLSPAINLGADRILAISVQGADVPDAARPRRRPPPTIAQIAGVLLDAVMLDAVESDVEHSGRVNRSVLHCASRTRGETFRRVEVMWLKPSVDFGALAGRLAGEVPPIVRYLLRGLGSDAAISELLSYLLFAPAFTSRLLAAGRADALAAKAALAEFLAAD
ncbi:MAG: patatin-like phospholipase family protein [Deltaproteobacteria bacterium]|nr:patatin-like phospholipase family protein [Deltaproteobacteria bacterium]